MAPSRCDRQRVRQLAELIERAGLAARPADGPRVSTGAAALDRLLAGGLRRGSLVEWLADEPGSGASALALVAARRAHADGGGLVVVDRRRTFYAPAAAAWGLDLAGTIVVHPRSEQDEHWALDQALRSEHVAAVLAWPRALPARTFRRLQLAAEASGAMGLLVRPAAAEREPTWADVRMRVAPRASPAGGWQLAVRLLRSRGQWGGERPDLVIDIDEKTGDFHEPRPGDLAPEMVRPTARQA
jgi:hypothetical protein